MSSVPEQCPACGASSETIVPTEGCTRCLACGWITVPIIIEPARIAQYVLMDLLRSGLNDFSAWVRVRFAHVGSLSNISSQRGQTRTVDTPGGANTRT